MGAYNHNSKSTYNLLRGLRGLIRTVIHSYTWGSKYP